MKSYRKRISFFLAITALLLLLCGCLSEPENEVLMEFDPSVKGSPDKTTVTFCGYKADAVNLVAIDRALNEFMDTHSDIHVTYEGIKGQPYWDAFELRVETGKMDDIVMIDQERMSILSSEGRLAELSDLETIDNYISWARDQFTGDDGSVYFLPTCISTYNLYINTDLLQQHGQKVPENMAEFSQVCDYFVSRGVTPVIANNYGSLGSLIAAKGMYPVYHGETTAQEIARFNRGEADLSEQLRPGIEMLMDMRDRGWLDGEEVLATEQTSDDLELFAQGERPFMITGGWASPRLETAFSYGVYPYPVLEDGSVLPVSVNTCISINAQSDHVKEAKELVTYLTQPDVMWNYCDSQSSYSPLQDERVPTDQTIAPSAPYLTNGRNVLQSDYNLELPLESALRECGSQIMRGLDTDSAVELLFTLLYSDESGRE